MSSFRTQLHGMTAWANMRLKEFGLVAEPDILRALFRGTTMKALLESVMGKPMKRMGGLDGLTQQQKLTRIDWFVGGLKDADFVPMDLRVDKAMFAAAYGNQVYPVLFEVVKRDIYHCWVLTPDMIADSIQTVLATKVKHPDGLNPQPEVQTATAASKLRKTKPSADECVVSMVNTFLKTTREGRRMSIEELSDLADSRILCALVNSLIPDTFTSEVMLNDRWTLNLILASLEKFFCIKHQLDSEDLIEADEEGLCAFMAVFFMRGFQLRQARKAVEQMTRLQRDLKDAQRELNDIPPIPQSMAQKKRKDEIQVIIAVCREGIAQLSKAFDMAAFEEWMEVVTDVQAEVREEVATKIRERFDVVEVPRLTTINELVDGLGINLALTGGNGFYSTESRESLSPGRKVVLQSTALGVYLDDFSGSQTSKKSVRQLLGIATDQVIEVKPERFPDYRIFFESTSRNRQLARRSLFLYQVFPGSRHSSQRIFLRGARLGEMDTIRKLTVFYQCDVRFVNCQDPSTGNTALHLAARQGHMDICVYLLECGAAVNERNTFWNTPLFSAVEKLHRPICQLLLEWGADINCKNRNSKTALELLRNEDLKVFLTERFEFYHRLALSVSRKDVSLILESINNHIDGKVTFARLGSRCVRGDTLLHASAELGSEEAVDLLLKEKMSANVVNQHEATALHKTRRAKIIQILLQAGASLDQPDADGNLPLHIACLRPGSVEQQECVEVLLSDGVGVLTRNDEGYLPVHCCAMQGNISAMQQLLKQDSAAIKKALEEDKENGPDSLISLALVNNHFDCADWLSRQGFSFKEKELAKLMCSAFGKQLTSDERLNIVQFLLNHSMSAAPVDNPLVDGKTALHLACKAAHTWDIAELLISYGATVTVTDNVGRTPLHDAADGDAPYTAKMLLEHGADLKATDHEGRMPFDLIFDCSTWIASGFFDELIVARLKAYSLKRSRELVRVISRKVAPQTFGNWMASATSHSMNDQLADLRMALIRTQLPPVASSTSISSRQSLSRQRDQSPTLRRHYRSHSAPATVSTTALPPIRSGILQPPSRMLLKSIIGINAT